jgi:hypothetical protein
MRHGSFTAGCKERSKKTEEQEEMISLMMAWWNAPAIVILGLRFVSQQDRRQRFDPSGWRTTLKLSQLWYPISASRSPGNLPLLHLLQRQRQYCNIGKNILNVPRHTTIIRQ